MNRNSGNLVWNWQITYAGFTIILLWSSAFISENILSGKALLVYQAATTHTQLPIENRCHDFTTAKKLYPVVCSGQFGLAWFWWFSYRSQSLFMHWKLPSCLQQTVWTGMVLMMQLSITESLYALKATQLSSSDSLDWHGFDDAAIDHRASLCIESYPVVSSRQFGLAWFWWFSYRSQSLFMHWKLPSCLQQTVRTGMVLMMQLSITEPLYALKAHHRSHLNQQKDAEQHKYPSPAEMWTMSYWKSATLASRRGFHP